MKSVDVRAKSEDELKEQLTDLRKESFNLRFQGASGQLENTARVGQVKKDIARMKTAIPLQSIQMPLRYYDRCILRLLPNYKLLTMGEFPFYF